MYLCTSTAHRALTAALRLQVERVRKILYGESGDIARAQQLGYILTSNSLQAGPAEARTQGSPEAVTWPSARMAFGDFQPLQSSGAPRPAGVPCARHIPADTLASPRPLPPDS